MSDILFAAILMSFFIGGSICAVGICIMQKFDELQHEIWELRMDLQDNKSEEKMKVDVVKEMPKTKNNSCRMCRNKNQCTDAFTKRSYSCYWNIKI